MLEETQTYDTPGKKHKMLASTDYASGVGVHITKRGKCTQNTK